jgi:hypothetical protein
MLASSRPEMTGNELSFNLGFPPTHSLRHPDRTSRTGELREHLEYLPLRVLGCQERGPALAPKSQRKAFDAGTLPENRGTKRFEKL